MGFSDVSKHSLPGMCQPHFTAVFMLLILTATQFKRRLGLKSCLFAYLCLLILFVSIHYREILLSIKPLWMPQQTCKHNAKWINWEVLGSETCPNRCSWINQLCVPTNDLSSPNGLSSFFCGVQNRSSGMLDVTPRNWKQAIHNSVCLTRFW